ncbi:thymic stromal lymphopoietin [Nannospalax galili]|uniref:thymic stromal lymphopoietin n=1 Tax=Nannospalax galili TaxID=1026970 RepID=UPI00111C80B9|nr:thymic stromal lymphopoietin [Nannospalax galili]
MGKDREMQATEHKCLQMNIFLLFVLSVFFRKLFVLQLVGLVLTYNFSNCDFKKIVIIYDEIISEDLKVPGKFTQIQPCYNASAPFLLEAPSSCFPLLAPFHSIFNSWRFPHFSLNSAACEQTDCLMKIEHQTFNPASGCPSLPRKPFAIKTKSTLTLHCPGYSGTQRNTTNQKTGKDIERNCRNQMLQIIAWWRHFCQIPK